MYGNVNARFIQVIKKSTSPKGKLWQHLGRSYKNLSKSCMNIRYDKILKQDSYKCQDFETNLAKNLAKVFDSVT